MTFSSSPVVYPPSSSPDVPAHLRKRPASDEQSAQPKQKKRLFGGERWDATNIPLNPAIEKTACAQEPIKQTEPVKVSAIDVVPGTNRPVQRAIPRALFKEPPYQFNNLQAPQATNEHDHTEPVPPLNRGNGLQAGTKHSWAFAGVDHSSEMMRSRTCSGKQFVLCFRKPRESKTYEKTIAERSTTAEGRATTSYYGIDIHKLIDEANELNARPAPDPTPAPVSAILPTIQESTGRKRRIKHTMWSEKYRARKFVDLVGDERTHRSVLRWLKAWDHIVFPGAAKPNMRQANQSEEERTHHRKILLLTGPPGLGKTTLAHVCARQAGYEVVEINASDERSRDVVKGRIRDCVGTENVRGQNSKVGENTVRKAGKPVCVVVDEVDGVVSGSGGSGDGGFMKALVDLVQLDQRNANSNNTGDSTNNKKKGDKFRLLRPMILICNDVYHPSLRTLRSSNIAEIVHIRKPALDKVVYRLKDVFEKEGIPADTDGVRRLCEATWGVSRKKDDAGSQSTNDGDLRSVLVVGEWAARKLRAGTAPSASVRLTRQWVETNMLPDLASGSSARGLGRGGSRETAERVFLENAGFSRSAVSAAVGNQRNVGANAGRSIASVSDASRGNALALLRAAIETSGETERIVTDVFTSYPERPFQDDTFLSKPNAASEWLHFHDLLASKVYSGQEWELAPHLATPVLGFHMLFGSTNPFNAQHASAAHNKRREDGDETEIAPFSGPRADFEANEAFKANRASLQSWHASLSTQLFRTFRSPEQLACDLAPYVATLLAPNVNPVLINNGSQGQGYGKGGGSTASVRKESEKNMVRRAAGVMVASGVGFERLRVEDGSSSSSTNGPASSGGWIWRMEPPIDELASYATRAPAATNRASAGVATGGTRFATRQVLSQEHTRLQAELAAQARQARYAAGARPGEDAAAVPHASQSVATLAAAAAAAATSAAAAATATGAALAAKGKGKRDFFGRLLPQGDGACTGAAKKGAAAAGTRATIWVTFHEGFSNAVRKPVSVEDILGML